MRVAILGAGDVGRTLVAELLDPGRVSQEWQAHGILVSRSEHTLAS